MEKLDLMEKSLLTWWENFCIMVDFFINYIIWFFLFFLLYKIPFTSLTALGLVDAPFALIQIQVVLFQQCYHFVAK